MRQLSIFTTLRPSETRTRGSDLHFYYRSTRAAKPATPAKPAAATRGAAPELVAAGAEPVAVPVRVVVAEAPVPAADVD